MADTTVDLAKNVIVNFKDVTSWVLLGIILIIEIVRYFQNVKLSETIESFKADLAKKEIKFTRHTELQIECLKKFYDLVVACHFSYTNLFLSPHYTHLDFQTNINTFQDNVLQTITYSHRNRILLPENIILQMRLIHDKFKSIEDLCEAELEFLKRKEGHNRSNNPLVLYGTFDAENKHIKSRIEKLIENNDVNGFEADIVKLRELIENYFKELVG